MSTDAGQRLIEDLRIFASMECCPEIHHKKVLAAADEIERLRGVEARMTRLVDAWTSNAGRSESPVRRSIYQCCARDLSAAIAASRSTGAADVGEDHG